MANYATYTQGERRTYRGPYSGAEGPMSSSSSISVLGPDGKLSTGSQAQGLKYAKPHELPSHPSVGVQHQAKSSFKAATLAAGVNSDGYRSKGTDTGFAAANTALKHQNTQPTQPNFGVSEDGYQKALLAATMSINRHKVKNSPVGTPPISSKAVSATRLKRIPNMGPEMFTEHPPVEIEKEVDRYQAALHASSISMAKQLYKLEQQKASTPILEGQPNYAGLSETARKLAADRLANLDPDGVHAFKEHYGYGVSMGRSGLATDKDEAARILARGPKEKMNTMFNVVDEEKRQTDRDALMALAEKRVQERLRALDEKVFLDTGKMAPSIGNDWEAQARAKAEANAAERDEEQRYTTLKVHIGGGKYMDMAEIEKIAEARIQPTLDEIGETAQKRRERDEEIRVAEQERKQAAAEQKAEQQKEKDERRMKEYQAKNEQRAKTKEEQAERDAIRKDDEAERKRIRDEERTRDFQEKNERRIQENVEKTERKGKEGEERAERKRIEAEQKAEREKLKAEDRAKWDRIKAEERADRERMRAEQKAEREARRQQEREDHLAKIREQNTRQHLNRTESQMVQQARDEVDAEDPEITEEVIDEEDETAEVDDAVTQIQVEGTTNGDVVEEEMTKGGIEATGAAREVASRVFGAPVDEVAEADKVIMSRSVETEDGGLKTIEKNVEVDQDESERLMRDHVLSGSNIETTAEADDEAEAEDAVETEQIDSKLSPAVTPSGQRRESRRKSFFNKLKSSFGTRTTKTTPGQYKASAASTGPVETTVTSEEAKVGPSIVGASGDGTLEHDNVGERAESEGGLYSEPSDTTERPNHDRAAEEDNVSSMYATDDADYDEARARTSTSSADRFDDARENIAESVATTTRGDPFDEAASRSHFHETA